MSEYVVILGALTAGIAASIITQRATSKWIGVPGRKPLYFLPDRYKAFLDTTLRAASPLPCRLGSILKNTGDVFYVQLVIGGLFAISLILLNPSSPARFLWAALALVSGAYLPVIGLERRARSRTRDISCELPGIMEIIALALQAGMSFDSAVDYVVEKVPGALGTLLAKARSTTAAGVRREDAYTSISKGGPPELRQFLETVLQAERQGKPVSDAVLTLADSVRLKQQLQFEQRANRLPTTMLMPIFLFIIPPVLLVYLLPAIMNFKNLT